MNKSKENKTYYDFQKIRDRNNETIRMIMSLDQNEKNIFVFYKLLFSLKNTLYIENFTKNQIRQIISKFWEVFLFKKFVLKTKAYNNYLHVGNIPTKILEELNEKYCKQELKNGIYEEPVIIKRNSKLHKWIVKEYLDVVKRIFRGVFGYSANIRYAYNKIGHNQDWDNRFPTQHANFHWDDELNSFSLICYLTDVSKNDGAFKVVNESKTFRQNLYLAVYDQILSIIKGADRHVLSNTVGRYMKHISKDEITVFCGSSGTSLSFYGRHILHDGGFPDVGKKRIALFLNQRNFLTSVIKISSKFLSRIL